MDAYQVTLILAMLFAIGEVLTGTFIFLSISVSLLLVSLIQFFLNGFSMNRDLFILILGSLLFTLMFRKIFKHKLDSKVNELDGDINSY